jgi:uncharacterized protein YndB with AHSA1/START domain
VWRYLTESDLRKQWFAAGEMELREGGAATLVFDHDNLSSDEVPYPAEYAKWKGAASRETVLVAERPRRLAFSWNGGSEGTASFELFEAGADKTRLVLTHSGISGPGPMADFGGGWSSHLAVLEAKLAGKTVSDFWALHLESIRKVEEALA